MGQPHLSDVYLVHISSHTNCTKKSRFQTPSCCPAASTQLRQIRKYLWQKIFRLPSRLFGGRPLLRTRCCGKLSCQISKRHHLTTCFGPPHVPATGVAKKTICKSMVPAFKVLIMKSPSHTLIHTNHRISPRFILHTDPTNERQKHATLCCIQLIQIKCG